MPRLILALPILTLACAGPMPLPHEEAPAEVVMQSEAALESLPNPMDPPPVIGPAACADICTATSRCDKSCGTNGTCGTFGVCQSCASACTTQTACGIACLENGQVRQCFSAQKPCKTCSAATCEESGCAGRCMNVPTSACSGENCTPTYSRCDAFGAVIDDRDSDGLPDALELALARQLFPDLHLGSESQKPRRTTLIVNSVNSGIQVMDGTTLSNDDTTAPPVVRNNTIAFTWDTRRPARAGSRAARST